MKKIQKGFTLIELMVATVVLAVLLSVGLPNLKNFLGAEQVTANSNLFSSSVAFARSEAAKRSRDVQVCASADQVNCTGADDWDMGWIVQVIDANEPEVIRVVQPEGDITINTTRSAVVVSLDGIVRDDTGALFSNANENNFQFCDASVPDEESLFLTINPLGTIETAREIRNGVGC